ncbi:MAG: EcsC family protein [Eubacterium sp.]|nr:EcsC family protein [Eubacterium sp.]
MSGNAEKENAASQKLLNTLDTIYNKALQGIPGASVSVDELAERYLSRDDSPEKAAKIMLRNQIAKCTTSGVVTGFGGFSTLPVSIPVNVASVLYMQLRLIACTARMAGFEPSDATVRAYAYACLSGVSIRSKKRDLEDIRMRSALRLLAKAGEKGVLNLAKLIPVIGAGVNGGIDYVGAKAVSDRAYQVFFENDYAFEEEKSLYRRGKDLYRKYTGNELEKDAEAFAARQKERARKLMDSVAARFTGKADPEEETVYVSPSGRSYHTDITHAGKTPVKMTVKEAEIEGYTPCRRCVNTDKDM